MVSDKNFRNRAGVAVLPLFAQSEESERFTHQLLHSATPLAALVRILLNQHPTKDRNEPFEKGLG